MKNALLVGVSLAALGIGSASAADMAARAPAYTKAPVMPVAVYNWSGFYIGGNAGGASSHNCWTTNAVVGIGAVAPTDEGCHNATGAVAGGQIGYAWNNVLWYGKGGAAVTHDKYNGISPGFTFQSLVFPAGTFDQASESRWGGVIGTGIEFGFAPGWSVAFEYDHLFMGNRNLNFNTPAGVFIRTDNIKQNVDMGTVRFNYTFGGPVVAKY